VVLHRSARQAEGQRSKRGERPAARYSRGQALRELLGRAGVEPGTNGLWLCFRTILEAQWQLVEFGWGRDDPAVREFFNGRFLPEASPEVPGGDGGEFNPLGRRAESVP
jgi:hypothetical protein